MELIHTEEGRITRSGSTYTYHYFLRDHLGNNRVGFSQGTNVTAPNFTADYYPFGLQYRQYVRVGNPKNNYLYNGKELQDGLKQYDYGARWHLSRLRRDDPVIGRWGRVDPMAETFDDVSPYNFAFNNPLRYIDPDGMAALDTIQQQVDTPLPESAVPGDVIVVGGKDAFELLPTAEVNVRNLVFSDHAGQQVMEPVKGFWPNVGYYLIRREYTDENGRTYSVDNSGKVIATMVTGMPPVGGIFKKGAGAIKIGQHFLDPKKFHRLIKPKILKGAGDFSKVVGKNPDIDVKGTKIILKGAANGPYKGKTFETGLDILDFIF